MSKIVDLKGEKSKSLKLHAEGENVVSYNKTCSFFLDQRWINLAAVISVS